MHQPLQTFSNFQKKRKPGKRESGPALDCQSVSPLCFAATRPTSEPKISQLFVTDEKSKRRFLVDTGAQVSVTPASWADKVSGATGPNLQAAKGSSIATYGSRVVHLHFSNRDFDARLISANVKRSLLGADFLRQHNLLVYILLLSSSAFPSWFSRSQTAAPPLSSHKHIQTASSSQLDQRNDPSLLCKQTSLGRGNYASPSLHWLSNRSDKRCIWCGHRRRPGTGRTWALGTTRIFQPTTA